MSRRSTRLAAGVAAAGIGVAVLAGAFLLTRPPAPTVALVAPRFADETVASGLAHTYDGGLTYLTGGGVAVLDCDGDGLRDLFLAGGANPAALYRNVSSVGGRLAFTRAPGDALDRTGVIGAYPLDIDGDGQADLAVLRWDGADLLRGLGGCRFEPAGEAWSFVDTGAWASAFSATWESDATLPTLAMGSYLALDAAGEPTGECGDSVLHRPDASGFGYGPPIPLLPAYCTLSVLFSDWDRSGRRDLRVTNDRHYYRDGQEQLWRITPGEAPRRYTADDGWVRMEIWGMGIASHDLTGDGLPEVYLTSQGDNKLQTLLSGPAQPTYRDIALKRGVTAARPFAGGDVLPSTAWHPEFQDVNNDGFMDLFVSKGNVAAMPDFASRDPSNLLLGQPDGTFTEGAEAAGILDYARGRGAALADFNLDGLLDLVQVNLGDPVRLWRNVGTGTADAPDPMGRWLGVRATQPGANRDAIGAWIEVRLGDAVLRRELIIGGGHAGGHLGPAHFGLGHAAEAEVRVLWPDGEAGPWSRVPADQTIEIAREAP